MRTFRIHFLSSFQIYNTVLLTVISMLHIIAHAGLIYNWKSGLFDHFSQLPAYSNHQSIFCTILHLHQNCVQGLPLLNILISSYIFFL